jgi:hypothetical protein
LADLPGRLVDDLPVTGRRRQPGYGPVPRFEKVERDKPADGIVIEGDDV